MSVSMSFTYKGELRCEAVHAPSQMKITTDAPVDNMGKGEAFSPTDLVGAALGTCVLTSMGIKALHEGIDMRGARAVVIKEMQTAPRRISQLTVKVEMPSGIPLEARPQLLHAAEACPVHRSLHSDISAPIDIVYPD